MKLTDLKNMIQVAKSYKSLLESTEGDVDWWESFHSDGTPVFDVNVYRDDEGVSLSMYPLTKPIKNNPFYDTITERSIEL